MTFNTCFVHMLQVHFLDSGHTRYYPAYPYPAYNPTVSSILPQVTVDTTPDVFEKPDACRPPAEQSYDTAPK